MKYTIDYQQDDKIHAIHKQIPTKQYNPFNIQSNTTKTIQLMQYTIQYQQNAKTHKIHNQIPTTQ